jgi:hypothetical protein
MTDTGVPRPIPWKLLLLAVGICVASGAMFWPGQPADVPAPVAPAPPRPPVPIDVGGPIDEPAATPAPLPPPVARTDIPTPAPQPAWQTIVLADGRVFVGTCDATQEAITVQAAVRGGALIRMQPIVIRVPERGIASLTPYDGALGPINGPFVATVDAERQADVARQRETAAIQAEQRRQEAAERERIRQRVMQRSQATKRLSAAEAALREATRREQELAANAGTLDEDRRLKLELANALQLQLNTAQDRWNQEVQTLGPRIRRPDGTWGGGPTEATETLVNSLKEQIRIARNGAAAAEQRKVAEAAERQQLLGRVPQLSDDIAAVSKALAELADPPAPGSTDP